MATWQTLESLYGYNLSKELQLQNISGTGLQSPLMSIADTLIHLHGLLPFANML